MHDMMIGVAKGTLIKLPSEFISWSSMIDVQSVSLGKLEPGGISLEEIIKSNQTVCSHMRMGRLHATCPKTLHTPITSFNRAYHTVTDRWDHTNATSSWTHMSLAIPSLYVG
jgi:hypothetical protein